MTWVVENSTTQAFENLDRSPAGEVVNSRWEVFVKFTVNVPGLGAVLQSYSHEPAWQREQHQPFSSGLVQGHRRFVLVSAQ